MTLYKTQKCLNISLYHTVCVCVCGMEVGRKSKLEIDPY